MANIYHEFYEKDAAWRDVTERIEIMRDKVKTIKLTLIVMACELDPAEHDHLRRVMQGCEMAIENMERRQAVIENRIERNVNSTHNVRAIERVMSFYAEDDGWMEREFARKGYLQGFKF